MFNNLYKFNPDSLFFKPFEWLWYNNEQKISDNFKTMCPLFWAMLGSIVFLPIVLIIRFFISDTFDQWYKERSEIRLQKKYANFRDAYALFTRDPNKKTHKNLLDKVICLYGSNAKEAKNYYTRAAINDSFADREDLDSIIDNYNDQKAIFDKSVEKETDKKEQAKIKRKAVITEIAHNKITTSLGFFTIVGLSLYFVYHLFQLSSGYVIDWDLVLHVFANAFTIVILYLIGHFVILPLLSRCGFVGRFFISVWRLGVSFVAGVGTGLTICGNMIYRIYKKNCPIITWEDTKE